MTNKRGFTLIELLVVVLIIGILAGIALPQYRKAVEKSRAAEAFANLSRIDTALQARFMAVGATALAGRPTRRQVFGGLDLDLPDLYPSQDLRGMQCSRYFFYDADCNPWWGKCVITAHRRDIKSARECSYTAIQDVPYFLQWNIPVSGKTERICFTGDKTRFPWAVDLCKSWEESGQVDKYTP